ncbi:MAG: hypothetical protein ACREBP_00030 [Sphingomicrobium sp.]
MIRAGQIAPGALDHMRPPLGEENRLAIHWHNLMGGEIDWTGLPVLAELHSALDGDELIERVTLVRNKVLTHAHQPHSNRPA